MSVHHNSVDTSRRIESAHSRARSRPSAQFDTHRSSYVFASPFHGVDNRQISNRVNCHRTSHAVCGASAASGHPTVSMVCTSDRQQPDVPKQECDPMIQPPLLMVVVAMHTWCLGHTCRVRYVQSYMHAVCGNRCPLAALAALRMMKRPSICIAGPRVRGESNQLVEARRVASTVSCIEHAA